MRLSTPWYILKALVETNNPSLSAFLASELKSDLEHIPKLLFKPEVGITTYNDMINTFHYSWFTPIFDSLDTPDSLAFYLGLFENELQDDLIKYYDVTKRPTALSHSAKRYLSKELYDKLAVDDAPILPTTCLPHDPLNKLLTYSRKELLTLVDYLSMHDLSTEMSTLLDARKINAINSCLPENMLLYLKKLSQTIEPLSFAPLDLKSWDGDETLFKKVLHKRGLNRLAKALSLSDPSLLWHLTHKLDIGRASIVKTLYKELKNKKAHKILASQVCHLIDAHL